MTGYFSVQRFRNKNLFSPTEEWKLRWDKLTERMGIEVPVRLMESTLAKVPMVIGHFRPLVLVPAGMLMSLPPQEAEAILLHELAHIRRRDYLMNLLQQVLECVFFFHPAVLWVCSLVSEEREHCCDDIASSCDNDKRNYINAMVSFYEHRLSPPVVPAFGGRKHTMTDRIRRLINHRNKTLNIMEKIFLTVALVVAGLLVHAYYNTDNNVGRQITRQVTDTIPKKHSYQDSILAVRDAEKAKEDAKAALKEAHKEVKRAEKEVRNSVNANKNNEGAIINEKEINRIVNEAMKKAEVALRELQEGETTSENIKEKLHNALQNMQQGIREAQQKLQAAQLEQADRQRKLETLSMEKDLAAISQEAVSLALEAVQMGLHEANEQIRASREQERAEKMNKQEFRERKKQLREEYRNSQRLQED